jgi:hypothetical protein
MVTRGLDLTRHRVFTQAHELGAAPGAHERLQPPPLRSVTEWWISMQTGTASVVLVFKEIHYPSPGNLVFSGLKGENSRSMAIWLMT